MSDTELPPDLGSHFTDWQQRLAAAENALLAVAPAMVLLGRGGVDLAIANNVITDITWSQALRDTAGMWSAGAPTSVTIRQRGVYQISVQTDWQPNATGIRQVAPVVTKSAGGYYFPSWMTVTSAGGSAITSVNASGTYVHDSDQSAVLTVGVLQSSGGNLNLLGDNVALGVVRIGN